MRRFVGGDRDERRETFERIVVVRWKGLFEEVDPQFGEQRLQALDLGDSPAFIGVDDHARPGDRKSVGTGKGVSVRVDLGGGRIIKKKRETTEKKIKEED